MAGGGPPGPGTSPTIVPYSVLVGSGATFAGVDQGIDFTGGPFPIYAVGNGIVTRVLRSGSGWPGQGAVVNYNLTSGPGKGRTVYVAEDLTPQVQVGQVLHAGDVVGVATGSGQAPGVEIGWAQPNGIPLAPRPAPRPAPQETQAGTNFDQFVQQLSGARPGHTLPGDIGGATKHIPGVQQAIDVGSFLGKIADPSFLLRALEVIGGVLLAILGLYLLTKQIGLGSFDVPDQLSPAARQAEAAAAAVQAQKAQRATETHEARISESQARVKTQQARATELRTRVKHRRRAKAEQNREVERAYVRGVAETAPLA